MVDKIPFTGRFLTNKRSQIDKINFFVDKINKHLQSNPQRAMHYFRKLEHYTSRLFKKNEMSSQIKAWIKVNPLILIHKDIKKSLMRKKLQKDLSDLHERKQLPEVFKHSDDKKAFCSSLSEILPPYYEVKLIGLGSAPTVTILADLDKYNDKTDEISDKKNVSATKKTEETAINLDELAVMRLMETRKSEDENNSSPRDIRKHYRDCPYLYTTWIDETVSDSKKTGMDLSYHIEACTYFEKGTVTDYIKSQLSGLHKDEQLKQRQLIVLRCMIQMIAMYQYFNKDKVWYCDLKPGNILVDDNNKYILGDIKALLYSSEPAALGERVERSGAYFDETVYVDTNKVDLAKLQNQNLAATMFELLTGKGLSKTQALDDDDEKIDVFKFDFEHDIFKDKLGEFFQETITKLVEQKEVQLSVISSSMKLHYTGCINDKIVRSTVTSGITETPPQTP